jgi:hypothetical protein
MKIIVIRFKYLKIVGMCIVCLMIVWGASMGVKEYIEVANTNEKKEYVVLAANYSGMKCFQDDFYGFMILPPGNNLKVQVFEKGNNQYAKLVTSGIDVKYEVINNTSSADKINFWEYASNYGYDLEPNVGITGNKLQGDFKLSDDGKYYIAEAIPVVPYNDDMEFDPYQVAKVTVTDQETGEVLGVCEKVVLPVSDEMLCSSCHGEENTNENILKSHDRLSGTDLYTQLINDNKMYKCNECHDEYASEESDNKTLSEVIHGSHADIIGISNIEPVCYSCHPGPITKCNRGIMAVVGLNCDNEKCHGDMNNVANSIKEGRKPWEAEPDCRDCHGEKYGSNEGKLYKDSYLQNAPCPLMNNIIQCEMCHNSPHSEWPSGLQIDNSIPLSLLGYESFIDKCSVCHKGEGKVHQDIGE